MGTNMKLIGNRIILRECKIKKKETFLLLEKAESPFIVGKIVAVGDTVKANNYGNTVLVNRQMAGFIEWDGEMLHMVAEEDIIASE